MKTAKQQDWKTTALPSKHITIELNRRFSPHDIQKMRKGLIPEQMEDKWFIYWKDSVLYFHRSWTGYCVYVVRFVKDGDSYMMTDADVNRDPEQYNETNNDIDSKMISYLIDVLLLQRDAEFPSDEPASDVTIIKNWSQVGRAMFGEGTKE